MEKGCKRFSPGEEEEDPVSEESLEKQLQEEKKKQKI
jgi:hypothetical protein